MKYAVFFFLTLSIAGCTDSVTPTDSSAPLALQIFPRGRSEPLSLFGNLRKGDEGIRDGVLQSGSRFVGVDPELRRVNFIS